MADIVNKYATQAAMTVTVASLANNGARQSARIDNSTTLYLDALVQVQVRSGASGTAATGVVCVYAYGSSDDGTSQTESAGASDAAITLTSPPNARLIGIVNVVANATTYRGGPFSVAQAFGGVLPKFWGIIVENRTGGTLDATGSNHAVNWQGISNQTV